MSNDTIETSDQGSRTMPDFVKKGLIRVQGGMLYLKAPYRVLWMREEHCDWSIVTNIEYADWEKGFVVVRATVMDGEGRILATAHAEESRGKLPFLRKAETGAIARALSLCGYGTQFGEINEEEFEGGATSDPMATRGAGATNHTNGRGTLGPGEPGTAAGTVNSGTEQCSSCHAPSGRKHTPTCKASAVAA